MVLSDLAYLLHKVNKNLPEFIVQKNKTPPEKC